MTSGFWYWDFNSQILTLELGKENLRSIENVFLHALFQSVFLSVYVGSVGFPNSVLPSAISFLNFKFFCRKSIQCQSPWYHLNPVCYFFFIKNFSKQVSLIFHRFISLILMFQEKFAFKNQKFCVVGNSWQWWIHVCWFKIFYLY